MNTDLRAKRANKILETVLIIILNLILLFSAVSPSVNSHSTAVETLSKYGSTGSEVKQIQQKLKSLGYYNGTVDGIYGTKTKNAVIAFQKNCGLTADGIAGPKTLLYLGLGSASSTSASYGGYSNSDVELLARVINAEARGESYTGQVAVGAVVLNRVQHASFPNTISGVIYQNGAFSSVYGKNWYVAITDSARKAAIDCINGWDPSGGAIYFYNPNKTSNAWLRSRTVTAVIGSHVFAK